MPRPPSEVIRELTSDVKLLYDRDRTHQVELGRLETRLDRHDASFEQLTRDLAAARNEMAALRQRSDDQTRQNEASTARLWALLTLCISAALSLASGLIVTLARK